MISLPGHIAPEARYSANSAESLPAGETVRLAITLPLRNEAELDDLIARLYDPNDPMYGQYLTPQQFADRYAPTQDDYNAVIDFARANGLSIIGTHSNRMVLDVAAPAQAVENAFHVNLAKFRTADGRTVRTPDVEPTVPAELAGRISGIVGLSDSGARVKHSIGRLAQAGALAPDGGATPAAEVPNGVGSGPGGSLLPGDIRKAYNLSSVSLNGSGQTLALCEFDGYKASDITTYESSEGIPNIPLQNVLIDGATGTAGADDNEVELDIELMAALAPGATKIYVYEAPNSDAGTVDTLNSMASTDAARQISTSWGITESYVSPDTLTAEQNALKQFAAQGQSFFAASGDSGAYANGSTLSVEDPASQPYATGVGGTTLSLTSSQSYVKESTWNSGSSDASGGGVSVVWSKPTWQSGYGVSSTMRNVPDVSLNADINTGYLVYINGGWYMYGGTSAAAPLWAAFTALANQQRASNGSGGLGFMNPLLYQYAGTHYSSDFHDINDGTTNLYYSATTGYDDATGLGSFNGANLLADLTGTAVATAPSVPSTPTGLTATAQSTSSIALSWTAVSGATSYTLRRSTSSTGTYSTVTSTTGTSYTDSGLTASTAYYYEVCAVNSAGTSAYSSAVSATTQAPTAPSTPTGLSATAKNSASIAISWTASTNATGYTLTRSTSSTGTYSQVSTPSGTSYTDTGLAASTTYYYKVCASGSGGSSAYTSPASATTQSTTTTTTTGSSGTSTVNLSATANVYVRNGSYAGTNYSGQAMEVKNFSSSGYSRASYLKFDLTSITSAPTSAKLTLTQNGGTPANASSTLSVYGVADTSWTETGMTWNTAMANDNLTSGGTSSGTLAGSASVSTNTGTCTIDVTSYLAGHYGKVVTLMIVDNAQDGNYFQFNSRTASTGAPVLSLTVAGTTTTGGTTTGGTTGGGTTGTTTGGTTGTTTGGTTGTTTGSTGTTGTTTNSGGTTTLDDIADSYVRGPSYDTQNYGTQGVLYVKNFVSDASFDRVTYLKFDLTSITTVPASAKLNLTLNATSVGSPVPVSIYGVADTSWTETGITWDSAVANDDLTSTDGTTGKLAGTTSVGPSLTSYSWDITAYIQSQIGKVVTLQVIDPNATGNYWEFNSKEAGSGQPTLTLN